MKIVFTILKSSGIIEQKSGSFEINSNTTGYEKGNFQQKCNPGGVQLDKRRDNAEADRNAGVHR